VARFFDTVPPTARLERGDRTVIADLVKTASGAKYEGQNVSFWHKGSEVMVTWMNTAPRATEELLCKVPQ
jgi:membrane-bound inhibitor of C-type lysozyme